MIYHYNDPDRIEQLEKELASVYNEINQMRERIRQLESERDQWQTRAVGNG